MRFMCGGRRPGGSTTGRVGHPQRGPAQQYQSAELIEETVADDLGRAAEGPGGKAGEEAPLAARPSVGPKAGPDKCLSVRPAVRRALRRAFAEKYHRRLAAARTPSDALLARGLRELEQRQPAMIPVGCVESLADARRAARAKRRCGPGTQRQDAAKRNARGSAPEFEQSGLRRYLGRLEALANMWGIAGCFKVQPAPPGSRGPVLPLDGRA